MDKSDVSAEKLISNARSSIGRYCVSDCKAYCCRKGYLVLTKNEINLIANNQESVLIENKSLTKINDDKYSLNLGLKGYVCPSLKENKCIIHKDANRPSSCKEFPLFIWENKIIKVSNRCPAVKENLMYPYFAKLKLLGYNLLYDSS